MIQPGGSDPAAAQPRTGLPARPVGVDIVAAVLVLGGLFGATQLVFGDYVITGQLPAKGPILGVAATLYAVSVALGITLRTGRAWLPALNLAALFAIVYLAALGRPVALTLGVAHAVGAVLLVRTRPWFVAMAGWRRPRAAPTQGARVQSGARVHGARLPGVAAQTPAGSSKPGGRRRPSGKR